MMPDVLDRWRHLLTLAAQVKALAPWECMSETDTFALALPAPHHVGLVSVMGANGEHFAVALYLGRRAIVDFWGLLTAQESEPEAVLEIDQLQLSWEDRNQLDRRDRQLLADLGLKPRGAHAWPMLRRYRAGYLPWFAGDDELDLLIPALEQLLVMAPRFRADPTVLTPPPGHHYLLRCPPAPGALPAEWQEQFAVFPIDEEMHLTVVVDDARMHRAAALPRLAMNVELDVFAATMMPIDGRHDGVGQPYYPYMLMAAEPRRGIIVGFELLTALQGLEEMWPRIPGACADLLVKAGGRPAQIVVQRPLLAKLLAGLCEALQIELRLTRALPAVAAARRAFAEFSAR